MLKKYLRWDVNTLKKYNFFIKNLDCANCARKIEEALNSDKNIESANVNFATSKVEIETNLDGDVLKYVNKIVKSVEPEALVYTSEVKQENITKCIIILLVGILLAGLGLYLNINSNIKLVLIVVAYIVLLSETFTKAMKLLFKSGTINENILITISCIGAFLIGKHSEGLMVIILYEIGKILEARAINKSRSSIAELMDIKPASANLKYHNSIKVVEPESIKKGDTIVVKTGEKIPLDGIVTTGEARINPIAITGESNLITLKIGDTANSGMINEDGVIEIKVTADYEDSTVNRILELVENAGANKAKTETFVNKAAKVYTPIIILLAMSIIVFGSLFTNIPFNDLLYRSLLFLVISCPCAIAISVPLSYFAGIGVCSKNGILVKGSNYLDVLKDINKIVFDKTGTITTGKFENIKIDIIDKNYKISEVKKIIVKGEQLSSHPIASSIVKLINIKVDSSDVVDFKEYKGKGIEFKSADSDIKIGNYKFCNAEDANALFYVNINDNLVARIRLVDSIKENAKETIAYLLQNNIDCEMLTGDSKNSALSIGEAVGLKNIKYELLPQDKYNLVKEYIKDDNTLVAFVGDGINDAPTLALANVGISMGSIGSESAIEASDVVIVNDDISKIKSAIKISKYTSRIIKENLIFAIAIKILFLSLGLFGIATMWQAVFADVGVTVITILNSIRILNMKA